MASLGIVTVPHPIGGIAEDLVARKATAAVDQVQAALIGTVAVSGADGAVAEGAAARHPAPDDLLDFQAWLMERGWGDGLPAIPATPERVEAMLAGTRRPAGDAVAAVSQPAFNLQAVQTTTHPCSPLVIVNGPLAARLGINGGGNALGQGHRANAVIGRALRLV